VTDDDFLNGWQCVVCNNAPLGCKYCTLTTGAPTTPFPRTIEEMSVELTRIAKVFEKQGFKWSSVWKPFDRPLKSQRNDGLSMHNYGFPIDIEAEVLFTTPKLNYWQTHFEKLERINAELALRWGMPRSYIDDSVRQLSQTTTMSAEEAAQYPKDTMPSPLEAIDRAIDRASRDWPALLGFRSRDMRWYREPLPHAVRLEVRVPTFTPAGSPAAEYVLAVDISHVELRETYALEGLVSDRIDRMFRQCAERVRPWPLELDRYQEQMSRTLYSELAGIPRISDIMLLAMWVPSKDALQIAALIKYEGRWICDHTFDHYLTSDLIFHLRSQPKRDRDDVLHITVRKIAALIKQHLSPRTGDGDYHYTAKSSRAYAAQGTRLKVGDPITFKDGFAVLAQEGTKVEGIITDLRQHPRDQTQIDARWLTPEERATYWDRRVVFRAVRGEETIIITAAGAKIFKAFGDAMAAITRAHLDVGKELDKLEESCRRPSGPNDGRGYDRGPVPNAGYVVAGVSYEKGWSHFHELVFEERRRRIRVELKRRAEARRPYCAPDAFTDLEEANLPDA
jgi:hypothetical protein